MNEVWWSNTGSEWGKPSGKFIGGWRGRLLSRLVEIVWRVRLWLKGTPV